MAKNALVGDGARRGALSVRSQVFNFDTHVWTNRCTVYRKDLNDSR